MTIIFSIFNANAEKIDDTFIRTYKLDELTLFRNVAEMLRANK